MIDCYVMYFVWRHHKFPLLGSYISCNGIMYYLKRTSLAMSDIGRINLRQRRHFPGQRQCANCLRSFGAAPVSIVFGKRFWCPFKELIFARLCTSCDSAWVCHRHEASFLASRHILAEYYNAKPFNFVIFRGMIARLK